MTVRVLLSTIDSRELSEWIAYFRLEKRRSEERKKPSPEQLAEKLKVAFGGLDSGVSRPTHGRNRGKRSAPQK